MIESKGLNSSSEDRVKSIDAPAELAMVCECTLRVVERLIRATKKQGWG